jgi:nitrate/TMAO reductase-like tetraheme cytochrome c subunit
MARRAGFLPLAFALVLGLAGAAGAQPAAPPAPPANDDCLACHGDPGAQRENGASIAVDPQVFERSSHGPLACVDCHQDLATLQEFPHPETLAKVNCASCHDEEGAQYHDSIHSWAKEKAGLSAAAPACADCHGTHDIHGPADQASRVFRAAPVCVDCHTAHDIQRTDTDASRLGVTAECGTCHEESLRTYRDTFHGQVTRLGFVRVATCADCHGAHDIHPKADPKSMVNAANRVTTCRKCHATANENFAQYDPHADRHDKSRSAPLYYTGLFMDGLLLSVFGFFGIHTALWLGRGLTERRRAKRNRAE